MNPSIFKTYDIRGIYPRDIDADAVKKIAAAQFELLKPKTVVVGYDSRTTSPEFAEAARETFISLGLDVYDVGMVPIEAFYFACGNLKADCGMMITASHNPREYNGIKMVREEAKPLTSGSGLEQVKEMALSSKQVEQASACGKHAKAWSLKTESKLQLAGNTLKRGQQYDIWPGYIKKILSFVDQTHFRPIKIACDASSGVGGKTVELLSKELPIETIQINFKPDGNFPNHEPNPMIFANREQLRRACLENDGISLGAIFDGDADRIIFLDEKGEFIDTDFTAALITKILLNKFPGQPVVYDLRRGWAIRDQTEILGSKYYPAKSGYPFIKQKMREVEAVYGGEASAHNFYRDFFYSDSSAITLLLILEFLAKNNLKMSEAIEEYKQAYFMYEETNYKVENIESVFAALKEAFADGKQDLTDGLSISYPEWHLNIRSSSTQPLVRLNIESKNPQILDERRDKVIALVESKGGKVVEE
jgi:phosphomannomutase